MKEFHFERIRVLYYIQVAIPQAVRNETHYGNLHRHPFKLASPRHFRSC